MRECWNWQTGQTKDLVVIAIVWVQVPSPASKNNIIQKDGVIFLTGAFLEPKGSRSSLRSGRRRTDIHRMSCAPSPAAAPHEPKGSRSPLRSGRRRTDIHWMSCAPYPTYADALAYRTRGFAITGLVYRALPMGAVPIGHNS